MAFSRKYEKPMSETVLQSLNEEGVLSLMLNRPNKKNAFSIEQWLAFREAIEAAKTDSRVACLLITGAGSDFSSGTDLNDFSESDEEHPFDKTARALVEFDKPIICAAKGIAVGGGATLLLQADIIYVGQSLKMRFPFVSLGLVPEWGSSYALSASIGSRRAAELMYTAEYINAERAVEMGIATAAVADDLLLDHAMNKAKEIAQWPISSLVATKQAMRAHHVPQILAAMDRENEGMAKTAGQAENIEAIMAFIEKRQPNFKQFRK